MKLMKSRVENLKRRNMGPMRKWKCDSNIDFKDTWYTIEDKGLMGVCCVHKNMPLVT